MLDTISVATYAPITYVASVCVESTCEDVLTPNGTGHVVLT
jgi:hypothetical protein